MSPRFNLLDEPWLPVRLHDGGVEMLGLLDVFRRSREIVALAETAPPSLVAEYRLLLAILHRALSTSLGQWSDTNRAKWYREGLPVEIVCSYLESWRERFWLFHDEYPFMQVAALATAPETQGKLKPWTQVSLASSSGNAPVVFDHAMDDAPTSASLPVLLAQLLGFLQFTPGGLVKTIRDSDKAGSLANTAAVVPVGPSLAQTLLLSLHPSSLSSQSSEDLPAWEIGALSLSTLRGDPVLATGPNDRYTRQTRAVLLVPESAGDSVRWVRFAAGYALGEDPQQPDPMACYRTGSVGLVRITFQEGRALWRDLPALVPAPQDDPKNACQPAPVVDSAARLRRLMSEDFEYQPILVAGLASDQAKLLRWRLEQFILPPALLTEPDRARELHAGVALAEAVARELRRLAGHLVAATMPDPASKDTQARARDLVRVGPLEAAYFADAERQLPRVFDLIVSDQSEDADAFWHQTLLRAARHAWDRQLAVLGNSSRMLQADARLEPQLWAAFRKLLPCAFSVPSIQTQGA